MRSFVKLKPSRKFPNLQYLHSRSLTLTMKMRSRSLTWLDFDLILSVFKCCWCLWHQGRKQVARASNTNSSGFSVLWISSTKAACPDIFRPCLFGLLVPLSLACPYSWPSWYMRSHVKHAHTISTAMCIGTSVTSYIPGFAFSVSVRTLLSSLKHEQCVTVPLM